MRLISAITLLPFTLLPAVLGAEYLVGVGKDETTGKKGLGFDPSVIHPAVGDIVVWEFRSGQHSVVQSTFDNPCTGNGGINTGVQTVADDLSVDAPGLPTIRITVNSTDPIWFFDEAGGLCSQGAILAINPSSSQTAAAFKENAAKASGSPPPPTSNPSTSNPTTSNPTTTGGSTSSKTTTGSTTTSTAPSPSNSNAAGQLSQHAGLALGALSFLALGMF